MSHEQMSPKKLMDYLDTLDIPGMYQKLLEIKGKDTDERDELKGRLLAIEDFKAVMIAHQGKPHTELKNFLAQDTFVLSLLKILIAETDPRKENVLSARAAAYKEIQAQALALL